MAYVVEIVARFGRSHHKKGSGPVVSANLRVLTSFFPSDPFCSLSDTFVSKAPTVSLPAAPIPARRDWLERLSCQVGIAPTEDQHLRTAHTKCDPLDRPSHADKRRPWRCALLAGEIRAVLRPGVTPTETHAVAERVLSLAA